MEFISYKTEVELISPKSANVSTSVRSGCLDIAFVNLGATTATVNGMPLLAGATLRISGQTNQFDESNYQVQCAQPVGLLGVYVIRKLYNGKKNLQ